MKDVAAPLSCWWLIVLSPSTLRLRTIRPEIEVVKDRYRLVQVGLVLEVPERVPPPDLPDSDAPAEVQP